MEDEYNKNVDDDNYVISATFDKKNDVIEFEFDNGMKLIITQGDMVQIMSEHTNKLSDGVFLLKKNFVL